MDNRSLQKIAGILWCPDLKRNIVILIVFFLVYLALGSATGVNSSSPGERADLLNESLSQDETFSFGTLNILDDNDNPHFCMVTLYDNEGVLKVSDFTNTLNIEIINPGSHLNIESNDNSILLDFSINGDSFDPVVRIADYNLSNPTSNYEFHESALQYISVDTSNLSYSNLRMAISYSGMDENIDTSKLKIFKYVETFAYNEWVELSTHIDELNQVVWTDIDSSSIFMVSMAGSTAQPQNITIGEISLLNSIGIPQPGEITIIGPEGNIIAGPVGTLTLDETPSGSYLYINSSETNIRLDFTLHADSSNPVILLEDFGTNNPVGDYSPPGEPVTYLMIGAENLGYSGVNLTLYYPDISGNFSIFRLSETFAYNEWEELPAVVDTVNNTITTSLDSLSIFALCKMTPVGVRVLDNRNAPLTVEIKTYDSNENPGIVKRGHTLSVDELPMPGYIAIDALVEKDIAVVFKSSYSSGGEIVLENYAGHNPEAIDPNRFPVKFVEIHARNLMFDSADIEIQYYDDEIGSLDENKLQISHFSGGAWVTLDSTVDTVNNLVRASTDSLSTFALVYDGTSVNTKKSIYRPGEMAEIMIVVLDSVGAPVSDAGIRMNVTAPEGSVGYFSTVTGSILETSDPGVYEAAYLTGGEGQYNFSCIAIIEGSESRFDTYFMVLSEYDFDIIRHAQSKIDPTEYDTFDMTIDITSYTDADTITIWEYVPANFKVYSDAVLVEADNLKVLTWQRSLVNNRTSVNYSYSVPMEWPKLYQLGPVEVDYGNKTFTEARPWWVAVDPAEDAAKLLVFTDKQVYRDELYEFLTLTNFLNNSNELGVTVFAMVLDDEGYINTTGLSFSGTLEDVELQDHQVSSSVHHNITDNPSGYGYDNITLGNFTDDGEYPDAVAGDGIFTSYTNVSELPDNITQQHLLINITVNETTSGISETVQVLFTRGGCKHASNTFGSDKKAAHEEHVVSSADQTACVICHWGYEHYLGKHKTNMTPVDVSIGNEDQIWNYLTGNATGTTTDTSALWSDLGDSHYCYTCHFSGTTGNGAWDFTTDTNTDRPSCNNASSVAGADCHNVTVIAGAPLTDIDWKWKSVGAGNVTSHNHTDTSPAVVSCEICHRNWHNNKLPNSSAEITSTEINDQCTICHSSTGPTRSENYTHDSDSTNCKACHLNTDQIMDPHFIPEAGVPNANCSECHDLGGQSLNLIDYDIFNNSDYVHNQSGDGKYPLNWNAEIGSATRLEDRICWGCHGDDPNDDGLANFSEQPAEHHPNRYDNPRGCGKDCHQNASSNWSAPQTVAHTNITTYVQTPGAPHCYDCHGITLMYNQSHQDQEYTISYKQTVAAHYGVGFPALEALRGTDEYCTKYCHQNTSSPFEDVFVDIGDMSRSKHSPAATRPHNQTCEDPQCHAASDLHTSDMKNPSFDDGEYGNANCTSSTCHPGFQNHSGTLNCTSCHMDNIGSNIHPIKYLQSDGETFSKVNNTAADCNLCHKETLADAKLTQWGLSAAKVGTQAHSEDTQNGSKWNQTGDEPYWTYTPQTITFATGWQANSERGFITDFENLTWTNDSAAQISEDTTEDSYAGHFPSDNEFNSYSAGSSDWSTSGTGIGDWSPTEGNPGGALMVETSLKGINVDCYWNASFNYPKNTEVAEALIKLDSRLLRATRLDTTMLKEINVSICDDSGNITEVYNRTLPDIPEVWIESGEISISNPDTVFWNSGEYNISIRTRFTTRTQGSTPDVKVGYDNVYLDVYEVDYKQYNFTIFINDTPASDRYELIMGYETHVEPAELYVLNDSVYEFKETLDSGAFTKLVVPLNEQEYNNGNITVLIKDSTGSFDYDVIADYLCIQYMFVRSYAWVNNHPAHYPCEYCHDPDQHYENALGMPSLYQGNNSVGQEVNESTNWCASCHYQGYQNADKNYTDMVNAFEDNGHIVPPEITGNVTYAPTEKPDYVNHSNYSLGDYNDSTCFSCHRGPLPLGSDSTVFVHHVTSGHIPKNVSITEITTNETEYSTNEMVEINITVDNSGGENITGDLNVSIRRQDGTILNNTELYPDMLILDGQNNSTTTFWDTTTTPPGIYTAYAQFDYINQTRPENITNQITFNITGIGATVQTNESQYRPGNTVNFTGMTYNLTSSVGDVDVNISVYYPNDTLSGWTNTTSDSSGNYSCLYDIGTTYPVGTYSVYVHASDSVDSSINSTTFYVLELSVNTTTDRTIYGAGSVVYITVNATYTNATTANNSDVNLTINNQTNIVINETSGTIDGDGFYYYQYTIPTNATAGTYSIITNVTDPEGYNESDNTTFTVVRVDAFLDSEPAITVMWQDQTKFFTLSVKSTGDSTISSGSVNVTTTNSDFTIQNQSSLDFTDLAGGSTASFNFNVTASTSASLGMHSLNATLLFDGLYRQKDVYVKIIPEPEIFVRTVTEKAVYLLDPELWVTNASDEGVWSAEGHPRNVTVNAMVVDQYGRLVPNERYPDNITVTYCAHNGSDGAPLICNGTMDMVRTGFYTKTIEVNETTGAGLGVDYLVHVNVTGLGTEVSGSTTFSVGRWGCDSCHKPGGNHGWNSTGTNQQSSVLGGANSGTTYFDIDVLTNGSWTHSSPYAKLVTHASISTKGGVCSPCHTGDVECTECHTYYLLESGQHSNVVAGGPVPTSCSNSSCHGNLTDSLTGNTGNVANCYPNCSAVSCHPISYTDNFTITSQNESIPTVPQWLNTTTGTPRNIAIHPNPDNAIVNCSFCHNSFHNIYDEPDTLTCGDCHSQSISYELHNGTTSHSSTSANCTDCHNFSSTHQVDIHNTITPACSECHNNEVNHSSYNSTGVNCLQCHHDRKLEYAGSVLTNGTYMMDTSIHSDNMVPECTDCHLDYSNHSSYDTSGVYCTYCHNNATLEYNSTLNLLVNDTGIYNTTYNTNTSIHTLTTSEMIPNCTDCHGSLQYQTHLGNETNVSMGLAANCTQCHNNQTLNYTGTILPVQGNYNTGTDIHTTSRELMLPNQTTVYNDNCGKCHYLIYDSGYDLHSGGTDCSDCHYGDNVIYRGTLLDRPIEHSINITRLSCTECHFNWTKMNDYISQPNYYVNGTMFNVSVHGNQSAIECRDCHTSAHPPPEYSWKWCECCHSYQSDPINETDRHNVTADPLSYSIDVSGNLTPVLDITDCTICHNATQYNTSKETFNRASGKDCRYCHTYPDQTYD